MKNLNELIQFSFHKLFVELEKFGYKKLEKDGGYVIFQPDRLFFIRFSNSQIEYGYAIKQMLYFECIEDEIWELPSIERDSVDINFDFDVFFMEMLRSYCDYIYGFSLKSKIKKVFGNNFSEIKFLESIEDYSLCSEEVCFEVFGIMMKVSRNYWTKSFYVKAKTKDRGEEIKSPENSCKSIKSYKQTLCLEMYVKILKELIERGT